MKELPGALTPWKELNQLLAPDERFGVQLPHGNGFLLVPRHSSQLSAMLFFLNQEKIPFSLTDEEGPLYPCPHSVKISNRAFSQVLWHENGVLEAGGGCSFSYLNQFLLEKRHEIPFEGDPLASLKGSIAEFILSGRTGGLCIREKSFLETIVGIDFVTRDGTQVRWGGIHRSHVGGPSLHQLMWDLKSFPGMILKVILKSYVIPPKRLRLSWSFRQREALWQFFNELKQFSDSWEVLDAILSGTPASQEYIFAQISGLPEEMEAFSQLCPGYVNASQQDERLKIKLFLGKQEVNAYRVAKDLSPKLGEYLWVQEGSQCAWLLTEEGYQNNFDVPLWKQRFLESFVRG